MSAHLEATHRGLARVWIDFESALVQVPVIARLTTGRLRIEDYRSLLFNLRQQVVEGGRWISRAASNFGPAHEELRSMFVIESLGQRLAGSWAKAIAEQLKLPDDTVSFLAYHGVNDAGHIDQFEQALELAVTGETAADEIVRHARIVARLYRLQLEELDNV